jgi:hypothetical protein
MPISWGHIVRSDLHGSAADGRHFRTTLSHPDRRLMLHYFGHADWKRLIDANAEVGNASWMHRFTSGFGDPNALLFYDTARIIPFPERRNGIAKLRSEIVEIKRSVRGG